MNAPFQWEYRSFSYFAKLGGKSDMMKIAGVEVITMPNLDKILNGLSSDGWELVSLTTGVTTAFIIILVRRPRR